MRHMILPLMLLAVGCQPAAVEQQAVTTGPDVEAITAAFQQAVAAANAGNVEGVLAVYADDVVSSPPGRPPMSGIAAIRQDAEPAFAEYTFQFTVRPYEVVVAGDLGVMRTSYQETDTPKGEGAPGETRGNWLIIWRKQADGSWKIWRDMRTTLVPRDSTT
jgi:uncharacterized protein (TIGR02246 family)